MIIPLDLISQSKCTECMELDEVPAAPHFDLLSLLTDIEAIANEHAGPTQ